MRVYQGEQLEVRWEWNIMEWRWCVSRSRKHICWKRGPLWVWRWKFVHPCLLRVEAPECAKGSV